MAHIASQTLTHSAASTAPLSATVAHSAGNLLVLFTFSPHDGSIPNASSVTDSAAQTWTRAGRTTGTYFQGSYPAWDLEVWYCYNSTSQASNQITITFPVAPGRSGFATFAEYSEVVADADPLDAYAGAATLASSGTVAVTGFTTTNADDLIICCGVDASPSSYLAGTTPSGFTRRQTQTGYFNTTVFDDKTVSSVESSATYTHTGETYGAVIAVAFKLAGGGGSAGSLRRKLLLGVG